MAVTNWHVQLIYFVFNGAAQTTALHIFTLWKTELRDDAQRETKGRRACGVSLERRVRHFHGVAIHGRKSCLFGIANHRQNFS